MLSKEAKQLELKTLLVGTQNSTVTLENSLMVSRKVNHKCSYHTIQQSTPRGLYKRNEDRGPHKSPKPETIQTSKRATHTIGTATQYKSTVKRTNRYATQYYWMESQKHDADLVREASLKKLHAVYMLEGRTTMFFINSPADGHLWCSHSLITNKAARNIPVQGFVWTHVFTSLG